MYLQVNQGTEAALSEAATKIDKCDASVHDETYVGKLQYEIDGTMG